MEILHILTTLILLVLCVDSRLKESKLDALARRIKAKTDVLLQRQPPAPREPTMPHLTLTHADGLILLTALRSRELYLRQVLASGGVEPQLVPVITHELTRLPPLIQALVAALPADHQAGA